MKRCARSGSRSSRGRSGAIRSGFHVSQQVVMASTDKLLSAHPPAFSRADALIIAACAISMLIVQMDWFALNLAIPAIARQFDMASTDPQRVVSGYMIPIGALMVTAGRPADIFGRRKIIVCGLVVCGVLSAVCGAAPDETWLIAARIVQGVGVALLIAFVAIESRVSSPLIDLRLFRNRALDAAVIAGSLSNVVYCLVAVFSAMYLQQARGLSPFASGLVFLALSAGAGSASYYA